MQHTRSNRSILVIVLAVLFGSLSSGLALTKEQILEISAKPHSVEKLHPGLSIFPHAREYTIQLELLLLQQKRTAKMELKVKEKIVEGRYIVTQFTPRGAPAEMTIITTFHPPSGLYLKTTLEPDGNIQEAVGTSTPGSRAICWKSIGQSSGQPSTFSLEQHTETQSTWTEITMMNDTPQLRTRGIAVKKAAKKPADVK